MPLPRIATALALSALVAGTALAPAPAAAMTNQEAPICSSAVTALFCITDTQTGSSGGALPSPPTRGSERIVMVGQKPLEPAYVDCGFGDIQAARPVDCQRRPGTNQIRGTAREPSWASGAGRTRPGGDSPSPLMRCALASATLNLVKDAKEYLTESRRRLGPDGKFPTEEAHRDFIAKVLAWKALFSEELLKEVLGRPSITSALSLIGMPRGMERLEHLWDLAVEEAKTTSKDPYCDRAAKAEKH